jgi:hypothetical protein
MLNSYDEFSKLTWSSSTLTIFGAVEKEGPFRAQFPQASLISAIVFIKPSDNSTNPLKALEACTADFHSYFSCFYVDRYSPQTKGAKHP